MKRMRKLVSTLLLVCMLATILGTSAFADSRTVGIEYVIGYGTNGGKTNYKTGESIEVKAELKTMESEIGDEELFEIQWYVGNVLAASGDTFTTSFATPGHYTVYAAAAKGNVPVYKTAPVTYIVEQAKPDPQYIQFATNYVKLDYYGDWGPNEVHVYPTGCDQTVVWSVDEESNGKVAWVDSSSGIVHAVGNGIAHITASVPGSDPLVSANFVVEVSIPTASIHLDTKYLNLKPSETGEIVYSVQNAPTYPQLTWRSSDPSVASVVGGESSATVTAHNVGTATIVASTTDGTAISNECLVTVAAESIVEPSDNVTSVVVSPVNVSLVLGETKTLNASINNPTAQTGKKIDHWYCTSSAVQVVPNAYDLNSCTVKALSLTGSPVEVRAYAADGSYGYSLITVSQADALELTSNENTVKFGAQATVSVVNARNGESFTWTYTPMDANIVASTIVKGNSFVMTAGEMDGTVTVTATSKMDPSRTASIMIGVNGVNPYGNAFITPKSVNWKTGDGDLCFQIQPAAYWTYLDNQYLNTKSTSLASYWNGTLTLKAAYLSTLSNGVHTLKVYTAYDEYNNPTGLVYANIYVTNTIASNGTSGVLSSNAHVKGTTSNLYFNSASAVKDVYISGKWIDPAN